MRRFVMGQSLPPAGRGSNHIRVMTSVDLGPPEQGRRRNRRCERGGATGLQEGPGRIVEEHVAAGKARRAINPDTDGLALLELLPLIQALAFVLCKGFCRSQDSQR